MSRPSTKVIADKAGGHHVVMYERRRYSNRTFTWVYLKVGESWAQLGDPWPCVIPAKAEVLEAIGRLLGSLKA